jgi:ribosomal protein L20A (L18A)
MYVLLDIILLNHKKLQVFITIYRIYKSKKRKSNDTIRCKKKRNSYSNVGIRYKDKRNIVSIVSVVNIRVKRVKETVETWILSLVLKYK